MSEGIGPVIEQLPIREEVPSGIIKSFDEPEPIKVRATTGLKEGPTEAPLEPKSFLFRARRAFSSFIDKIDTNKENKPPLGKAF